MHAYKVISNIIQKFVPPHLEYCAPIWNPYYCKDIDTLEKVEEPQGLFYNLSPHLVMNPDYYSTTITFFMLQITIIIN